MHLTDAVPVLAGAPSVVQEEGGNDLSRGQGDELAAVTENCAMADFLKSCHPGRPSRPVRPRRQGAVVTLVHSLAVAVPQPV